MAPSLVVLCLAVLGLVTGVVGGAISQFRTTSSKDGRTEVKKLTPAGMLALGISLVGFGGAFLSAILKYNLEATQFENNRAAAARKEAARLEELDAEKQWRVRMGVATGQIFWKANEQIDRSVEEMRVISEGIRRQTEGFEATAKNISAAEARQEYAIGKPRIDLVFARECSDDHRQIFTCETLPKFLGLDRASQTIRPDWPLSNHQWKTSVTICIVPEGTRVYSTHIRLAQGLACEFAMTADRSSSVIGYGSPAAYDGGEYAQIYPPIPSITSHRKVGFSTSIQLGASKQDFHTVGDIRSIVDVPGTRVLIEVDQGGIATDLTVTALEITTEAGYKFHFDLKMCEGFNGQSASASEKMSHGFGEGFQSFVTICKQGPAYRRMIRVMN